MVAAPDRVAVDADLDQRRGGDLLEHHVIGVDQEMMLGPRDPRRQMGEDQIVPAVQRHQPIGGGKVDPRLPLAGGIAGVGGGGAVDGRERGHDLSPIILSRCYAGRAAKASLVRRGRDPERRGEGFCCPAPPAAAGLRFCYPVRSNRAFVSVT